MVSTKEILEKYSKKLNSQIENSGFSGNQDYSSEYLTFKEEMIPQITSYEKWAKSLGNILKIKVAEKDRVKIQKQLDIAHLDVTPSQVLTLSAFSMLIIFFSTIILCVALYLINPTLKDNPGNLLLFGFLGMLSSTFIFYYTYTSPERLALSWRLKASSQMVPAILYVVIYMKHTSNLERAIHFASEHLEGPLALDFKKIFYNVEIGKFSTIKSSLENYLQTWKNDSPEFIESFHLIESSLFEPSESRRVNILEKALQVILDGIYEKMLKYSREIRSPLTSVYMLGIVLPTLGIALLPLASALLGGVLQWPHVFVIFNVIIPFFVFYLTSKVLTKRPGGYGESSALELNPNYKEYKNPGNWTVAFLIAIPFIIIGLLPFILNDFSLADYGMNNVLSSIKMFDFRLDDTQTTGPFGILAIILSLFIPLGISLFFITAYKAKTKNLIKVREETKILEEEFTNSLFHMGNRLGDGIPAEIAFAKVAETTTGQKTEGFFALVNQNIQQFGMSIEKAMFDRKRGAIIYYPSSLISTSMKILIESVKKGLQVAARSLMSISEYVKNIQKINQRLRDLLAEIVSDMKSNMTFLAPLLTGIVIGLSSMITLILARLADMNLVAGGETAIAGMNIGNITNIFNITKMIPPYFLQLSIGIYLIEIIFILTITLVTVDSGKDSLKEKAEIAKNLKIGMSLYLITALLSIICLALLAIFAIGSI